MINFSLSKNRYVINKINTYNKFIGEYYSSNYTLIT